MDVLAAEGGLVGIVVVGEGVADAEEAELGVEEVKAGVRAAGDLESDVRTERRSGRLRKKVRL